MANPDGSSTSLSAGLESELSFKSSQYAEYDSLRIRNGVIKPNARDTKDELILIVNPGGRKINVFNVTAEDYEYLDSVTSEVRSDSLKDQEKTGVSSQYIKYTNIFDLNLDFCHTMKSMVFGRTFVKPFKLISYKEGSFLTVHRDINHPKLIGKLILILPTTYTGGEIYVGQLNVEARMPKDKLRFVYFDVGLEHSVKEVKSGRRIALVYNVFSSSTNLIQSKIHFYNIPEPIYQAWLRKAIKYCVGRENILIGHYKYRNDVFYRLLEDMKKAGLEVIEVFAEKDDFSHCFKKKNFEPEISSCFNLIQSDEFYMDDVKEYTVDHVLFPTVLNSFQEHSTLALKSSAHEERDYKSVITAFLINPVDKKTRKKGRKAEDGTNKCRYSFTNHLFTSIREFIFEYQ